VIAEATPTGNKNSFFFWVALALIAALIAKIRSQEGYALG
jgi:hypothetical protein